MKEFSSCKQAIQTCIANKYFAIAHLYNDDKPMDMHIHDCYEIYFSISGGKQFLIDNRFYTIQPGDIFFINQFESHYLTQIDQEVHERILISIYPDFLKKLSSPFTDLITASISAILLLRTSFTWILNHRNVLFISYIKLPLRKVLVPTYANRQPLWK